MIWIKHWKRNCWKSIGRQASLKKEKTIIEMKNGRKIRIKRGEAYHFTYEHIVKEIIDTGVVEE